MTVFHPFPETLTGAAAANVAGLRRGACPSLAAPMMTGDGLLVRLRPAALTLSPTNLSQIAAMAGHYGNGIVEITARGNLQLRGLVPETVPALSDAIDDTGIALSTGLAIEVPPLTGLDDQALADPRPLAVALRRALEALQTPLVLAPKLAVVIDGGGYFHLGEQSADVRARAMSHRGDILWHLSLGGTDRSASPLAAVAGRDLVAALLVVLTALDDLGPAARGRDIDCDMVRHRLAGLMRHDVPPPLVRAASPVASGLHYLDGVNSVLGLGLAYGQVDSDTLSGFADVLSAYDGVGIRLCPGHGMLITGLDAKACLDLRAAAVRAGFHVDADDPALQIAVCAGRGACRSGLIDTKESARLMLRTAPGLFDGSLSVHLSGCAKGCSRPSASVLTLVGSPSGAGLVVNGPASGCPIAYLDEKDLGSGLQSLQRLVEEQKHAGESVRSCLTRLGTEAIATAVQQG